MADGDVRFTPAGSRYTELANGYVAQPNVHRGDPRAYRCVVCGAPLDETEPGVVWRCKTNHETRAA